MGYVPMFFQSALNAGDQSYLTPQGVIEVFSFVGSVLPFWILGVPLVVAVISWMRMPRQGHLAPRDHRNTNPH